MLAHPDRIPVAMVSQALVQMQQQEPLDEDMAAHAMALLILTVPTVLAQSSVASTEITLQLLPRLRE